MNSLWEYYICAAQTGVDRDTLRLIPAHCYSPYMELSLETLNDRKVEEFQEIEVNPYYRYHKIFKKLFLIDHQDNMETKVAIMDYLLHDAYEVELVNGRNKGSFYNDFLEQELLGNVFGLAVKDGWDYLSKSERKKILEYILTMFRVGSSVELAKEALRCIFTNSYIYLYCGQIKELLIYMAMEEDNREKERLQLLLNLFLPVECSVEIYWNYHFGIIGLEETMHLDEMELY